VNGIGPERDVVLPDAASLHGYGYGGEKECKSNGDLEHGLDM